MKISVSSANALLKAVVLVFEEIEAFEQEQIHSTSEVTPVTPNSVTPNPV